MVKIYIIFVLSVFIFLHPNISSADGYYCHNDGYFAYEYIKAENKEENTFLSIIFFGSWEGILDPIVIPVNIKKLTSFSCNTDYIVMSEGKMNHIFDVSNYGKPFFIRKTQDSSKYTRGNVSHSNFYDMRRFESSPGEKLTSSLDKDNLYFFGKSERLENNIYPLAIIQMGLKSSDYLKGVQIYNGTFE